MSRHTIRVDARHAIDAVLSATRAARAAFTFDMILFRHLRCCHMPACRRYAERARHASCRAVYCRHAACRRPYVHAFSRYAPPPIRCLRDARHDFIYMLIVDCRQILRRLTSRYI